MSEQETAKKRTQGVVQSDKMDKTVTVAVTTLVKHPLYGKYIHRECKHMAHDPENSAREGDLVEIESIRPLSRRKRWRVVRIVRRGSELDLPAAVSPEALTSGPETTA